MAKYSLDFKETALRDLSKIKRSGDKVSLYKIQKIILELAEHPKEGVGKPELLKYELSGTGVEESTKRIELFMKSLKSLSNW